MAQDLATIIGSLGQVYDPQTQLIQQQQQAMPAQFQAQQAGLDQAKTNAFTDITNGANARGMMYSGMPIDQQSRYVGEKYLPAVAGLKQAQQDQTFKLQDALNKINEARYNQAQGIQQAQQKQEADDAYRQQQLQMEQYKAQLAAQSRVSSRAPSQPSSYDRQASFNQQLQQAFQGYNPKQDQWFTERAVIPTLVAQTGLPADQVAKQVYAYRKAAFGE